MTNKIKLQPIQNLQTSQTNLKLGLEMTGKALMNNQQWVGTFAQHQNQHQYPKDQKTVYRFSNMLINNFGKFKLNKQVCGLCMVEKQKTQMEVLCKCQHKYCYSCLNSYVILKIEQLVPVKCPQQQCSQLMKITSNVYRYLPDSVKLKYLQNPNAFSLHKKAIQQLCQRCLQPSHIGECKFAMSPLLVEQTFKHRVCPQCNVEIRLTEGKKKVKCSRCMNQFCYMCGMKIYGKTHNCGDKVQIRNLEKQRGYKGGACCCDCCLYGCDDCCVDCGNCCCRSCGDCCIDQLCCGILFYCEDSCSFACCLWNIISIPVRLILTMLLLLLGSPLLACLTVIFMFWILLCFLGGFFGIALQVICQSSCPKNLLFILIFPLVGLYGVGVAIKQTSKTPFGIAQQFCQNYCSCMSGIWVEMSPKRCSY